MQRELRDVVFVDGVRTPFGKAKGQYAETRADDLVVRCIRELLRRNPGLDSSRGVGASGGRRSSGLESLRRTGASRPRAMAVRWALVGANWNLRADFRRCHIVHLTPPWRRLRWKAFRAM